MALLVSGRRAPLNLGTALLLTDGTVLAQDDSSGCSWYRLRPDQMGDYEGGTWTRVAQAGEIRRDFAAIVLADGRVLVIGGRNDMRGRADPVSAEIYDPQRDSWIGLPAPDGWRVLGHPPCCLLPDATVLVGNIETGQCALFDPELNAWRQTGDKTNRSARGDTWTLLPDGSVLSIDGLSAPSSEIYAGGNWSAMTMAAGVGHTGAGKAGPAVLRMDGTVLALGAGATSAIFSPAARNWVAGAALPLAGARQLTTDGAPACLLSNGHVLFLASTGGGAGSTLYVDDGTAFSLVDAVDAAPDQCRLLALPSGRAMLTDTSPRLAFYTPAASPAGAWTPVIAQSPPEVAPGETTIVRGRRASGLAAGWAFGDAAAWAQGAPLVRLRAHAAPQTVTYCRGFDYARSNVGAADEAYRFGLTVPAGLARGKYALEIVANGAASSAQDLSVLPGLPVIGPPEREDVPVRSAAADKALQEEMLWRDLNEVHLLMDFISGKSDLSLTDLGDIPNPDLGSTAPMLSAREALHAVSVIRFPPQGDIEEKARQAQLLLSLKDRLNRMAFPARGLSIAYTSMFSGTGGSSKEITGQADSRRPDWFVGIFGEMRPGPEKPLRARQVTGFAIASYPNLEKDAHSFKRMFGWVPAIALLWLVCTALTYWDVALSSQTLRPAAVGFAVTNEDCNIAADHKSYKMPPPAKLVKACDELMAAQNAGVTGQEIVAQDGRAALFDVHHVWHPVGWIVKGFGPQPQNEDRTADTKGPCQTLGSCDHEADVSAFAAIVVSVFTDYILPMMFGVLGTLTGLIRNILAKVRDSTLSPRDYRLMFSLIPIGAVAGLAVGLMVTPSSAVPVSAGLPLTLSAAGLAFLAGYGADAFFGMIDGLLMRVFAPNPPLSPGGSK